MSKLTYSVLILVNVSLAVVFYGNVHIISTCVNVFVSGAISGLFIAEVIEGVINE